MEFIYYLLAWILAGGGGVFVLQKTLLSKKSLQAELEAQNILRDADKKKEKIIDKAEQESKEILKKAEKSQERIQEKEDRLEKKLEELDSKQTYLSQKEEDLRNKLRLADEKEASIDEKISQIAGLSQEEARDIVLKWIEKKYESDAITQIEKYKKSLQERKDQVAREILIKSMQQYAWDVTNEVTTTLIPLPSDDIKWKLIGKEGRNIVAFERATGVALIIDDTPDTAFISAFDLFKRYIAKKSLERLIQDGRIQPARIEEIVETTTQEAETLLKEIGTKALHDLNITGIPEEFLPLIGKMRFRTSYGQNILKHSTEVAYIAEAIAKDLKLDPVLAKKWGFLHDVGKTMDHDVEGTHPEIGARLGRKYGLSEDIVDMIENHHNDPTTLSIYTAVVQVADAISSVRPWARRESVEKYIQRVQEMENLVASFDGVKKAYAISAGREVRVFVDSDTVTDIQAHDIARNIAVEIESKLQYPGEVKVNLIREMRIVEYAK